MTQTGHVHNSVVNSCYNYNYHKQCHILPTDSNLPFDSHEKMRILTKLNWTQSGGAKTTKLWPGFSMKVKVFGTNAILFVHFLGRDNYRL